MNSILRRLRGAKSERGIALVSLLVILVALTALSMGLIVFSRTEVQIADNQKNHTNALFVTEAGVQEVMARMNLEIGSNVTVNGSTFDAHIGDNPGAPNPNWETKVYLTPRASLPPPVGGETVTATVQPSASWLHYGDQALGVPPISVRHKWVDRNLNGVREANELVRYDGNVFPPENFTFGQLVEEITSSGIVNGSRRQVKAEITRIPLIVNVTAAITSDNGMDLTGNMTGCGHNHRYTTPAGTKDPACHGWELCFNRTQCAPGGCLVGVMTTGDDAETGGSSDLAGFPAWSDTSSSNTFYQVWEYLGISQDTWNDTRNDADYHSANDAVNMNGICVVDGDATGTEKFNGNVGTGLLYVNGDMEIAGNFIWRGLIYCEGNCTITGTAWILGAICVRGVTSDDAFTAGNSTVLYSKDAITLYVGQELDFTTLAWNEL